MATSLPVIKIAKGKYLIGTHQKSLQIKGDSCIVRTGGGFMELEEYFKHYARNECITLQTLVKKQENGTVKTVVVGLLRTLKADEKSIAKNTKRYSAQFETQFKDMMAQMKVVED